MQHHLKNFYTKLVFKEFGKMSQLILQFRVDKNKIKEFVIKEDKLESYNKEIKTLIQQIEKKMYLSKSISGGINKPDFFVSQPNIYEREIDSEFIVYLSKDFNYYLDLYEYEKDITLTILRKINKKSCLKKKIEFSP